MGYSSPAVANGRVYVGCNDNKTYCLNASTGAFIWSYTTSSWVDSSPAVAGGRVYVGSWDGEIYCLDATTGALVWSYFTCANGVFSSPAIAGGHVYVGSNDHKVYCLPMILGPSITHPSDITYRAGATGNSISWTITSSVSDNMTYAIYRNGTLIATGSWTSGTPVTIAIDDLAAGIYNYTIVATDGLGGSVQSSVLVTVTPQTPWTSASWVFLIISIAVIPGVVAGVVVARFLARKNAKQKNHQIFSRASSLQGKKSRMYKELTETQNIVTENIKKSEKNVPGKVQESDDVILPKTEKEISELQKTEQEVSAKIDAKLCLVHKGEITGGSYACPNCKTLYCLRCAAILASKGEGCWSCGQKIDIEETLAALKSFTADDAGASGSVPGGGRPR